MSGHTPGPWRRYDGVHIVADDGPELDDHWNEKPSRNDLWITVSGQAEDADAQLVAAAPELLTVAQLVAKVKHLSAEQRALTDEEDEKRGFVLSADRRAAESELWRIVDDVLAKAEGRT